MSKLNAVQREMFRVSNENLHWFSKNYTAIKKKYDKHWIIVKDKKIVGQGKSFEEINHIARKYKPSDILVEFVQTEQVAMFF